MKHRHIALYPSVMFKAIKILKSTKGDRKCGNDFNFILT
jgi:hypothetical protein